MPENPPVLDKDHPLQSADLLGKLLTFRVMAAGDKRTCPLSATMYFQICLVPLVHGHPLPETNVANAQTPITLGCYAICHRSPPAHELRQPGPEVARAPAELAVCDPLYTPGHFVPNKVFRDTFRRCRKKIHKIGRFLV
jgi:hypothetical protein